MIWAVIEVACDRAALDGWPELVNLTGHAKRAGVHFRFECAARECTRVLGNMAVWRAAYVPQIRASCARAGAAVLSNLPPISQLGR